MVRPSPLLRCLRGCFHRLVDLPILRVTATAKVTWADLVDAAESGQKYLFLNTIREIIIHNAKCLQPFTTKLLPLLIEQAKNQDEQIRSIVAENLGRLFIYYSADMSAALENSLKSASALERATVTKAFKYSASKETNAFDLQIFVELLIRMVGDADITVKRYALESLTAITHV